MADFPRCAMCRTTIEPGHNVVFRSDGRVEHVECPAVTCPVCARQILPGDPIRRNGEEMLHGNCWVKRHRAMAGGSADSPWTVVSEWRARGAADMNADAFTEFIAAVREATAEARAVRRYASLVRRRVGTKSAVPVS